MDAARAKKWMQLFNEKIQNQKDYLSDLDTPIGDGDHGANMVRGMAAAVESLAAKDFASAAEVFQVVSMQLISKVGGASGPLYGSAFMGMAKAEKDGKDLSGVIQAGLDMIQKRGKAVPGEKTMVDVWSGIPLSLQSGELTHEKIGSLVEATKDLKATKGRASYVGERSIGHIDPGSASSGLLFEALLETEAD
ncbi:dihydroxyacetone kinase DAK2 domain protein [Streptococcus sanguinis SK150]|jgi:dihydroxyacetone kinase, L subunit|uniref:phosphoenolpyruvate--glycerone phosphotransferase n=1 Tax=Streptococcus sanguinis SK150 TaxID=888811 RepID=F0IJ97_STRSA|nr:MULTISPECIES: dihydroxyacetone kinase subunit DhaL [Streptococcus]EGD37168.1 dihydroxyacetone kinase DAK2 domain protein [Streptococcus sanguinis SK150]MBZ2057979.1 dihydroxyacetone kinase subunit L [Streptococcus sanguinis]MDN5012517.1 dihydroxyacetone kinase subunit DhaL [Streptococcus sp. SN3]RSI35471.1 PTS-dependent dihydroxyacetone kinase, ADP-binding subunit DhaL [Streptococcus sanguinis]WNU94876.1 dihydroxyacetone kinase subunit DhaL [Streptococcus sp. DTU_2020_1000888_1_SI_GRL_NUU_0